MFRLPVLMSVFAVLALLVLGAAGPTMAADHEMPCHETAVAAHGGAHAATPEDPAPAAPKMAVMACCIACTAAPVGVAAPMEAPRERPALPRATLAEPLIGLTPSPDLQPPRA